MSEWTSLVLYSGAIIAGSLLGGSIPLWAHAHGRRTEPLLAFSAGVMLGAAFFQMIPAALHEGNLASLSFVLVGALAMFLIERFAIAHVCEEPESGCEVHGSFGLAAFLGMSVHTLFDGVALGSSLSAGIGGLVFLAVIAHKIPSSLALGSILTHDGYRTRTVLLLLLAFALSVPLGAGIYFGLRQIVAIDDFAAYALAFSAGTFLYLALADLLPQVHKKVGMRGMTVAALLIGVSMMYLLRFLGEGHGH